MMKETEECQVISASPDMKGITVGLGNFYTAVLRLTFCGAVAGDWLAGPRP